jgi:hypothetical protein
MDRKELFRNILTNLHRSRDGVDWQELEAKAILQLLPMRAELTSAEMMVKALAKNEGIELEDSSGQTIPPPVYKMGVDRECSLEDWAQIQQICVDAAEALAALSRGMQWQKLSEALGSLREIVRDINTKARLIGENTQ